MTAAKMRMGRLVFMGSGLHGNQVRSCADRILDPRLGWRVERIVPAAVEPAPLHHTADRIPRAEGAQEISFGEALGLDHQLYDRARLDGQIERQFALAGAEGAVAVK